MDESDALFVNQAASSPLLEGVPALLLLRGGQLEFDQVPPALPVSLVLELVPLLPEFLYLCKLCLELLLYLLFLFLQYLCSFLKLINKPGFMFQFVYFIVLAGIPTLMIYVLQLGF